MNWIRQAHRWVSVLFTLTVTANFVAMAAVGQPPMWITMSPLPFLLLLWLSGAALFVRPFLAKGQAAG